MNDTRMHSPSPSPGRRPRSAAQEATYDALIIVFRFLAALDCDYIEGELVAFPATSGSSTIRGLPLVCRTWREAGQATIWKGIVFSSRKQCELFLRAAKSRPDLAKQVRAVSVGRLIKHPAQTNDPADEGDWHGLSRLMLECLKLCNRCQHVQIAPLHPDLASEVFETVRNLPLPLHSLLLRIYDAHHELAKQDCIEFYLRCFDLFDRVKTFQSFEINFRPPYLPTREEMAVERMPISPMLSYHSTCNSVEAFLQSLRMMPKLKRLALYLEWAFVPEEAIEVFANLTELEELRVESNIPTTNYGGQQGNPRGQNNMWLNALLPKYKKLRILSVTEQDSMPSIFSNPPPSLEFLEFIHFGATPSDRFFEFEELLRDTTHGKFSAVEFVFVADEEAFERTVSQEDVDRLVKAYAEKGTSFRVEHEIMELPVRRFVDL